MQRYTSILILSLLIPLLSFSSASGAWLDDSLVTIDGTKHTTEDFKKWWHYWNNSGQTLPETPEFYIDWLLFAREGEQMGLTEDPSFKHTTNVFLKVRSLLLLQQEEVVNKINITENEIKSRYEKLYTPVWLVARLQFADQDSAQNAWKELQDGTVTPDELKSRSPEKGGPTKYGEIWLRPHKMDQYWVDTFRKLNVGEASEPVKDLDFYVFYFLKEKEEGSSEEFGKFRDDIYENIFKERRDKLTGELLVRLQKKYKVKVDQERVKKLDMYAPEESFSDDPIITTNRLNVSEKEFAAFLRKEAQRANLFHSNLSETEMTDFKNRVISSILGQNLTNWEALDRHYEEKEPFKDDFQFNVRHRLTQAVQQRLFASSANVSEDEIKAYYMKHISRYTQPEVVDLVLIQDTDDSVDRIWGDVATGKNFFKAVEDNTEQKATIQSIPSEHLEPEVQEIVRGLTDGETSQPFSAHDKRFIVYLVKRTLEKPIPLEQVEKNISGTLMKEKVEQQRDEYLKLLKSRTKIEINDSNWQKVRKELGK